MPLVPLTSRDGAHNEERPGVFYDCIGKGTVRQFMRDIFAFLVRSHDERALPCRNQ
jgi:hypothetical protein